MGDVSDREMLQMLAEKPIGSPALQDEASRVAHIAYAGGRPQISAELRETGERCNKKWLPQGKKATNGAEVKAAKEAFYARQIDLEDAVEAAGGQRGGGR